MPHIGLHRWSYLFLLFAFLQVLTCKGEERASLFLKIEVQDKRSQPVTSQTIDQLCKVLENQISRSQGPWQTGIFDSVNCAPSTPVETLVSIPNAILTVKITKKKIAFQMKALSKVYPDVSFENPDTFLRSLDNEDLIRSLSLALLDPLPMVGYIERPTDPSKNFFVPWSNTKVGNPPSEKIYYYDLKIQPGEIAIQAALKGQGVSSNTAPGWNMIQDPELGYDPGGGFFHWVTGPGAFQKEWITKAQQALAKAKAAEDALEDANHLKYLPQGFLGLRYGIPGPSEKTFIAKSRFFGLLAEIRSGIFDGLSLYLDQVPEVRETAAPIDITTGEATEQEIVYGWQRKFLGWSFRKEFNSPIIQHIDIKPSIGMWNFKLRPPVTSDNGDVTDVQTVTITQAWSIGAEVGIEKYTKFVNFRLWGGRDFQLNLPGKNKNISSTRYGFDAFINGPQISKRFRILPFLFADVDKLELTDSTENGGSTILSLTYYGLGVAFGW